MTRTLVGLALMLVAACSPRGVPASQAASADSADQVMEQMVHTISTDGIKTVHLEADSAWVYNSRRVIDLKSVRMTFYSASGAVRSRVTSDSGVYHLADGTLDARGNVVATTPPPDSGVLKTEHLVFDKATNRISSDTAYTFTSTKGNGSGASFETDPDFRRFTSLQPRGRQRGEGFLLPGQDSTP